MSAEPQLPDEMPLEALQTNSWRCNRALPYFCAHSALTRHDCALNSGTSLVDQNDGGALTSS